MWTWLPWVAWARLTSEVSRLTRDVCRLNEALVDTGIVCTEKAQVSDAAIRDVVADVQAKHEDLTSQVAAFDQRVSALTELTELSLSAVRARDAWKQAFDTSAAAVGAFDALLQQHYAHLDRAKEVPAAGWRHILQDTDGTVVSVRQARDGQAPTRIERGHGRRQSWYRLTRVEGLALIYTPEPELS